MIHCVTTSGKEDCSEGRWHKFEGRWYQCGQRTSKMIPIGEDVLCPPSCHPVCVHCALCQSEHHRQNHIRNNFFANLSSIVKTTANLLSKDSSLQSLSWRVQLVQLQNVLSSDSRYNYIRCTVDMMLLLTHYCARRHCASILFLFAGCAAFLLLNLQRNPTHCSVQTSCCLQWGDWVGCIVLITLCNPIFLL